MINYRLRDYPRCYVCACEFDDWYAFIAVRHIAGSDSYAERRRVMTAFKRWCTKEFGAPGADWIPEKHAIKFFNKTYAALFKVRWC